MSTAPSSQQGRTPRTQDTATYVHIYWQRSTCVSSPCTMWFMCTCMCTNRSIIPCGNVSLCWLQTPSDACCACLLACLSAWCTPPALDRPREPQLVGSPFREQEGDPPPHPLSRWASAGGAGRGREGSAGQSAAAGRLAPLQLQEKGTST